MCWPTADSIASSLPASSGLPDSQVNDQLCECHIHLLSLLGDLDDGGIALHKDMILHRICFTELCWILFLHGCQNLLLFFSNISPLCVEICWGLHVERFHSFRFLFIFCLSKGDRPVIENNNALYWHYDLLHWLSHWFCLWCSGCVQLDWFVCGMLLALCPVVSVCFVLLINLTVVINRWTSIFAKVARICHAHVAIHL